MKLMAVGKEAFRRGDDFPEEGASSEWDTLGLGLERQESSENREATKKIARAAIEASRKISDSDHNSDELLSDNVGDAARIYDAEMEARHQAEERHDHALEIVDALIFDNIPIPENMRELVASEGGVEGLRDQVRRENAMSFGKFELINAYDSNHGSFSGFSRRQMEAIRYLAEQAGQSERAFMAAERARRNTQRTRAVEMVRQTILRTPEGMRNVPYDRLLSFDDFDVMAPFDPHELERRAREQMFLSNYKPIMQNLSGRGPGANLRPEQMSREEREGRKYIINKYGAGDESRAESRIRQMASEVFEPTAERRNIDRRIVMEDVERIRERDIQQAVAEYRRTGNVRRLWDETERLVRGGIPMGEKLRDVKIVFDETTDLSPEEKGAGKPYTTGQYRSGSKEVVVFLRKYREKSKERGETPNDARYLEDVIDTIAHELYHAYQRVKAESDTTEHAVRLALNWSDYQNSEAKDKNGRPKPMAYDIYRRQLLEREAFIYGEGILDRFKTYL